MRTKVLWSDSMPMRHEKLPPVWSIAKRGTISLLRLKFLVCATFCLPFVHRAVWRSFFCEVHAGDALKVGGLFATFRQCWIGGASSCGCH